MPGSWSFLISASGCVEDDVDSRNDEKLGKEVETLTIGALRSEPSELSKEVDPVLVDGTTVRRLVDVVSNFYLNIKLLNSESISIDF